MIRFSLFLSAFALFSLVTKAQCPAGSIDSNVELVTNGDFEQGNVGFTSDYIYTNIAGGLWDQNHYAVGTQASFFHDNFDGTDHTSGSGNFIIVNGAPTPGVSVWCQTVAVQPNTLYLFSSWVTSVNQSNTAALQFSINGQPLGNVFNAPAYEFVFPFGFQWPGWTEFNTSWFSGPATSATICILNQETTVDGNDFGLDDISFQECTCNFQTPAVAPAAVCSGQPATLDAGASATSFNWIPSTGLNCDTCQIVTATPDTTTTYTLIATVFNCSDTVTTVVTVDTLPVVMLNNDTTVCANETVTLTASGGVSYAWTPAANLSDTSGSTVTASASQSTTYTVVVTNASGCTADDSVAIDVLNSFVLNTPADTAICFGDTVALTVGPFPNSEYSWLPFVNVSCADCNTVLAFPDTTTTYTVTITTGECWITDEVTVTIGHPVADAGADQTICANEPATLSANGGTSYAWNPISGLSSTTGAITTATVSITTTYTLTVLDAIGCAAYDEVVINVNSTPSATVGPDENVCLGDSVGITASGGTSYAWSPATGLNVTTGNAVTVIVTDDIAYTVTVTDDNGCTDDAQVFLNTVEPHALVTSNDTLVCYGLPVTLTATGASNYNWSGPQGSCSDCSALKLPSPTQSGTYHVEAIDSNGCVTIADVQVLIDPSCAQSDFPTAFSPNGDGLNEFFRPVLASVTSARYFVYNRWGQLMYEGDAKDQGWDGTFNGQDQPHGSYAWHAEALTLTGETLVLQGYVLLVR